MANFGNLIRSNIRRIFKVTISLAIIIVAGWIWHEQTEAYHFAAVTPGVLYRSGWMQPHGMNEMIQDHGIRTVVNLCLPSEETYLQNNNYIKEQEICKNNGVKLVYLPMAGNTPPNKEQISQWISLLNDKNRLPILVHCAQGVTRTGMMVAIYQIQFLHKTNKDALTQLNMFGHKLDDPKREKMRDFISNYKPADPTVHN